MHEDLLAILHTWENVERTRALQAELRELERAVERARAALDEAREQLDALREQRAELRREEHRLQRRLDSYQERAARTRRLIDTGAASDYQVAVQQLASCERIVDETETALLELMERADALDAGLERAEAGLEAARAELASAERRREERAPGLAEQLAALERRRPELEAAIPPGLRGDFRRLLGRGLKPVARLVDGACSACHYAVPPQVQNEVLAHRRVHSCRHCGRFLVPPGD